ncbi:acetolactate synthase small subunit [Virgibacillus halodenitrificans]|jgi:acetolactate synthase I/III small subunit|uniref:Acetolactate synthase small subunit n=1 Tax=Virgibacillus halodenitrificans TaxID=1482 RepID=A0AAC9J2A5_VIRHA|nr:acetolactate synthase small subunit [Virgibacillus halodenitrificans]APC49248.1 acetolactate synthase small subunit [Virgibacillus halodenitrificans]MBD1222197.1 acetolactate synthase small subunit [Virgibacillus halodenitrificans]MCG1026727.1 acetolactate synthase small subunit [Virgibacillus halodenitrificans]MCJ0930130.1 acetolactate synthase small subunit [Virgibacillus halodenitrificans]MEC2161045.1 acetolactate synthase small subunit [Virgibacillus halodenitrificans]
MKRIIVATVQDRSGVLNRITGMLQKRQFNIDSISVGSSETEGVSKMTFVVDVGDHQKLEQLTKQLNKQIDVLKVSDITDKAIVARELALIKVGGSGQLRSEIQGIITPFRASIIDVSKDSLTIQVTGKPDKVEALISLLKPYGIKELTKTGVTAFLRGQQPQQVTELNSHLI